MASQAKPSRIGINKILLATDFSPEAHNALRWAISLAERYGSTILLAHVLSAEGSIVAGEAWPAVIDVMRQNAEKSMARLENTEGLKSLPHNLIMRSGGTWDVISEILAEKNVDLIVMGTQGQGGIKKLFLGSTAETVIRHAGCPVLTVGPNVRSVSPNRFGQVLFASDFSSGSKRALTYALSLAKNDRAELTLLHVIATEPASDEELSQWQQQDREKLTQMIPPSADLPYKPEIRIVIGAPEMEIVRQADQNRADLIVMGCHSGDVMATHLPWTITHHVLRHAHCPVLTVRGEGSATESVDTGQGTGSWFSE